MPDGVPTRLSVFVDAVTGELLAQLENVKRGTGSGDFYNNLTFGSAYDNFSFSYLLKDTTRYVGTIDMDETEDTMDHFFDTNDAWGGATVDQRAAVDAQWAAERTFDYYLNLPGGPSRNGIDGSGGPRNYSYNGSFVIGIRVHYGSGLDEAFWDGEYISLGDGDVKFGPSLAELDVIAHEWTHGVTENEANLTYSGESGALNESWSDVFGDMVENYAHGNHDWRITSLCYGPGNDTDELRSLADPHHATDLGYTTDDDPDHYSERYTGDSDYGGIHHNSGISNKAFYLLTDGGSHHLGGSMTGIGETAAARIWYVAQVDGYLTSDSTFAGARKATRLAAISKYGSSHTNVTRVEQAWDLVGVKWEPGEIRSQAGTGTAGYTGDGGDATSGKLNQPYGIVVDSEQNVYVADSSNHVVRMITPAGVISTVAGTGTSGSTGDHGLATYAKLNDPRGIALDSDGNLYISDTANHKVRKVNRLTGIITTYAGTGTAGFSGDGGDASFAKLNYPRSIAVVGNKLFIADTSNQRLRRVNLLTDTITTVAGNGTAGYGGDGGSATSANLNYPRGYGPASRAQVTLSTSLTPTTIEYEEWM